MKYLLFICCFIINFYGCSKNKNEVSYKFVKNQIKITYFLYYEHKNQIQRLIITL